MADERPRIAGTGQPGNVCRKRIIPLTVRLTGAVDAGFVQLPFPCRTFRFVASSGVAIGDVIVAPGKQDPASGFIGQSMLDFQTGFDPVAVPVVRIDEAVTDLSFYSRAALAGESITVFAFRDASIALSGAAATIGAITISNPLNAQGDVATGLESVNGVALATTTVSGAVPFAPVKLAAVAQTISSVGNADVTVLAANATRLGGHIQNHGAARLGIAIGGALTYANCAIKVPQDWVFDLAQLGASIHQAIHCIRAGAAEDVGVVEYT